MSTSEDWSFFARECLEPDARRKKPIGFGVASRSHLAATVAPFLGWTGAIDVLETMAGKELAWLSDDPVQEIWMGIALSNGGAFLLPAGDSTYRSVHAHRAMDVTLSAGAAGLCSTILLVERLNNSVEKWTPGYRYQLDKLRAFAQVHPERNAIVQVLD